MFEAKEKLRANMLDRQRALTEDEKSQAEQKLVDRVTSMEFWRKSQKIGCYLAFRNELRTKKLIEKAWSQGKGVYVPVVEKSSFSMYFVQYEKTDELEKSAQGVFVPSREKSKVRVGACDCFIMPACCLDQKGHRLGYGKGFYDRFLKKNKGKSLFIGVAYACNRVEKIPCEEHDVSCEEKIWV